MTILKNTKILNNKLSLFILLTLIIIGGIYYHQSLNKNLSDPKTARVEKDVNSKSQLLNDDKVLSVVKNLPEVKEWLNLFSDIDGTSSTTGGKPVIEIDSIDGSNYTVHVYESMEDHNATFNWYYVDLNTGSIKDFFGKQY